jgi:hypothetical protein
MCRNSCGPCEEHKALSSLHRQFKSYLVLVAFGVTSLSRDLGSNFHLLLTHGTFVEFQFVQLQSSHLFHRFLSPLSAVPLVSLAGFGLYELGFPGVSIIMLLIRYSDVAATLFLF